jgi:CRISPR-associated protein Csn2
MSSLTISFTGLENQILVEPGAVTVVEVHNVVLFSRICQSLLSELAEEAIEPYSLWDEKAKRVNPKGAFIACSDVFNLPWDSRTIVGKLFGVIDSMFMEDESIRSGVENLNRQIVSEVDQLAFQLDAQYSFNVEWALTQYLKAFGFSPVRNRDASLLENLIQFLDFASDMSLSKPLLFVNLKNFLAENQICEVFERIFFHDLSVLLIEHTPCDSMFEHERKMVVEQDFTEYLKSEQSECTSLSQEGICSNGFGTVTF